MRNKMRFFFSSSDVTQILSENERESEQVCQNVSTHSLQYNLDSHTLVFSFDSFHFYDWSMKVMKWIFTVCHLVWLDLKHHTYIYTFRSLVWDVRTTRKQPLNRGKLIQNNRDQCNNNGATILSSCLKANKTHKKKNNPRV